jgi:hypothetical protein
MAWLVLVALILIALTWLYTQSGLAAVRGTERFLDYWSAPSKVVPDGVAPELASVTAGPLLEDTMTPDTGLSGLTAGACWSQDRANELQLGGQYAQRTNNYRHAYPDSCSALRTEFVDSMYKPRDGVGMTPPLAGQCRSLA